jgi:hypothetical protein
MIVSRIQKDKDGEHFFEIPESEVVRLGLQHGDTIRMDLKRVPTPTEDPEAFQKLVEQDVEGVREMLEDLNNR